MCYLTLVSWKNCEYVTDLIAFSLFSAPAASTGGFSIGTALGTAAAAPAPTTSATQALGLGGSLFGQKPTGGFSFNTPASSKNVIQIHKQTHKFLCS